MTGKTFQTCSTTLQWSLPDPSTRTSTGTLVHGQPGQPGQPIPQGQIRGIRDLPLGTMTLIVILMVIVMVIATVTVIGPSPAIPSRGRYPQEESARVAPGQTGSPAPTRWSCRSTVQIRSRSDLLYPRYRSRSRSPRSTTHLPHFFHLLGDQDTTPPCRFLPGLDFLNNCSQSPARSADLDNRSPGTVPRYPRPDQRRFP